MRCWAAALGVLVFAVHAASGEAKIYKIAILTDAMVPWHPSTEGFRDGLKEQGLVEGQTATFDVRATRGDPNVIIGLYDELRAEKPDLLVCVADTCKKENGLIPMVFMQVDPVVRGLVRNIARPEGNITGVSDLTSEMTPKRLELFKELVPSLKRVLISYDPREAGEVQSLAAARSAALRFGIALLEQPVTDRLAVEPGIQELNEGGEDGILIVQAGTNLNIPGRSFEVAFHNKLPAMYPNALWADVGALASYSPDSYALGRQAARIGYKIVTGTAAPGDLPVEQAERFVFTINLKTAKALGYDIPPQSLVLADRVIE